MTEPRPASMTREDGITALQERGYKNYGSYALEHSILLTRRIGSEYGCLTNEYKLSYSIHLYDPIPSLPNPHVSTKIEIVGEYAEGLWCTLNVYALTLENLLADLDQHEADLKAAWETMCQNRRRGN